MALKDDLYAAYRAGDLTTLNRLIVQNGVTEARGAAMFGEVPGRWGEILRGQGVVFADDQVAGTNLPGAAPAPAPLPAPAPAPIALPSIALPGPLAQLQPIAGIPPVVYLAGGALALVLLLRK